MHCVAKSGEIPALSRNGEAPRGDESGRLALHRRDRLPKEGWFVRFWIESETRAVGLVGPRAEARPT